jgi:hypothetical protein
MSDILRRIREFAARIQWERKGKPIPLPNALKQAAILKYARDGGTRVFVETGTYEGRTLAAMVPYFDRLYSVELGEELYRRACARFASVPKVRLFQGDSGEKLEDILGLVADERCLFWLDAHYSRGDTARGSEDTPICRELSIIGRHSRKDHVILIDDARCFGSDPAYPAIPMVEEIACRLFPASSFSVLDDIIRIVPHAAG